MKNINLLTGINKKEVFMGNLNSPLLRGVRGVLLVIAILCVICGSVSAQSVDTEPFNITPAAPNNLVFVQPPAATISGAAFNPEVTVRIRDIYNNNTTASNQITLSVSAGATLGGTYTNVAAVSGLATFTGVTITGPDGEYTLTAASDGLTQATAEFTISAYGAPTTLAWVTNPVSTTAGNTMTAFTVRVTDAYSNNVPGSAVSITATVTTPLLYQGGTAVAYATAVSDASGIATFGTISMTLVGTNYIFRASSGALPTVTSTEFNITPNVTTTLTCTVQPGNTVAGVSISPAVQITAYDLYNNVVPGVSIAMIISPDGTYTDTLTVTTPQTTNSSGVATFSNAQITLVNTGYRLRASVQ